MKNVPSRCPRCNATQKFGQQRRKIGNDQYEIFIRCSICRWEQVAISGTSDNIRNYREIQRLKIRAEKDPRMRNTLRRKRNGQSLDTG